MEQFLLFINKLQSLDLILVAELDQMFLEDTAEALNITEDEVINLLTTGVTRFAANFGIYRNSASYASGTIYYCRYSANPLPSGSITVPAGARVKSMNGTYYTVTEARTMYAATASLDADLNAYVLAVPVEAEIAGTIGNASAYTITTQVSSTSFDFVTNKSDFTNGVDMESDTALVARVKTVFTGNNAGTLAGWKQTVLNNTNVTACYVAGAGDPAMVRDPGYGGFVDIYVRPKEVIEKSESILYAAGTTTYTLSYKPVERISSVTGTVGGVAYTFLTTDYVFYKDTKEYTVNSADEESEIRFIVAFPDAGTTFTVVYEVDDMINQVTTILADTQYQFPGVDVLIRQATPVACELTMRIVALPAYNVTDVINDVKAAIGVYISGLDLGQKAQQSDIIAAVEDTAGVDRIILPLSKFNEVGVVGIADYIDMEGYEYASLAAANLIVST